MANYIKPMTGEVKSQGAWRKLNPNISFPKVWDQGVLDMLGLAPIMALPKPAPSGDYVTVYQDGYEQDANGNWVAKYLERPTYTEYTVVNEDESETIVTVAEQIAVDLTNSKNKAFEALANLRYEKEIGGTTFNAMAIATDRESQSKLIAGRTLALEDAAYSVSWKVSSGVFIDLDASAMIAIADVVRDHVQTCYSVEKLISEMISACATNAEVDAVDLDNGWP